MLPSLPGFGDGTQGLGHARQITKSDYWVTSPHQSQIHKFYFTFLVLGLDLDIKNFREWFTCIFMWEMKRKLSEEGQAGTVRQDCLEHVIFLSSEPESSPNLWMWKQRLQEIGCAGQFKGVKPKHLCQTAIVVKCSGLFWGKWKGKRKRGFRKSVWGSCLDLKRQGHERTRCFISGFIYIYIN